MATSVLKPGLLHVLRDASADPNAGTIAPNGKPIVSADAAAFNLVRTGYDWYYDQYGEADDGVLNYGFWTSQAEVDASYHKSQTIANLYATSYAYPQNFTPFSAAQIAATELAIGLWDDIIAVDFQRTSAPEADLAYMNTIMSPAAGAGAFLPGQINGLDEAYEALYGIKEIGRLSGDVFVNRLEEANFEPAVPSSYALQTLIHETGHALGLEHVGDYNASDDNDGDGVPDPITYANDAFIFQDSHQYSVMSYFASRFTGASTYDFSTFSYLYPSTPMVHDILAMQRVYGVETNTRAGDTIYGFNSTADRLLFDFSLNNLPVLAIWDGGGNDTLDFSGWSSNSVIDLNPGSFSSGGGSGRPTLEAYRAFFDEPEATQEDLEAYLAERNSPDGMLRDNISIAYNAIIENAVGGAGDDVLVANGAANRLDGGAGNDLVSYETSGSSVSVNLANGLVSGGAAGDVLISIEGVTGSRHNDVLTGSDGDNVLNGLGGNDIIYGRNGDDEIDGGAGNDQLFGDGGNDTIRGGEGNDTIMGGAGDDILFGDAGNDTLYGDAGNDTLDGGAGDDKLYGGAGADTFRFSDLGGYDTIVDFRRGQGDKIDLSGIALEGEASFSFVGNAAFSGTAGEVRTFSDRGSTIIAGDVDGDGAADFQINVGATAIRADDLILTVQAG